MKLHHVAIAVAVALPLAPSARAQDESQDVAWSQVAEAYNKGLREKRWEQFRELASAYCAKNPKHFEGHWLMGMSFEQEANKGEAHTWFVKASNIDPEHFDAALRSGMGFMRYQKPQEALPYLERARKILESPEAKGLPENEDQVKLCRFSLPGAIADALWSADRTDDAIEVAKKAAASPPTYPGCFWFLGQSAEAQGDRAGAIALYKKAVETQLDTKLLSGANHQFGLEDHRSEAADRANFLHETTVRYGEVTQEGLRFKDAANEFQLDLPHPKILRLKKGERYPWIFTFPEHKSVEPGKINTHIITCVRQGTRIGSAHDIVVIVQAAPHNVNMTGANGESYKMVEPQKVAEGLYSDMTTAHHVDVTDAKAPAKQAWGRGYKGYYFTFKGREKAAVENYNKIKAEGRGAKEPPIWDTHVWLAKGKKQTWWVVLKAREDFYKRCQRECLQLLRGVNFP